MPSETILTIFSLVGGLAIFIYGMNFMSDGLQKLAGDKLRRIIEILTGNPVIGILVGMLVTALLQSSSATTVMMVGFVTARLMTLPQAVAVILGANIGTTITAQLVAFKISNYAYPIAFIGFVLFFFIKRKKIKYIGQSIFAFGLLFVGLEIMGSSMKPLASSAFFTNLIKEMSDTHIFGFLIGTVMTVVVQSSSATIAVLQSVAQPETAGPVLIPLATALPVLFGCNVGTTITAVFASIGGRLNSKRAAMAHIIFNVAGSVAFMFIITAYARLISLISPDASISRQIANSHTLFNVANTLIWLPFIGILAKIVTKILPGEDKFVEKRVIYLDYKILGSPALAMDLATKELSRMANVTKEMVHLSKKSVVTGDMRSADMIMEYENVVDMLQYETVKYLSKMLSEGSLTNHQSIRLSGLMHAASDIERIGDHCKNIAEFAVENVEEKIIFSESAKEELNSAFEVISQIVNDSINALYTSDEKIARKVLSEESEVDNLEQKLRETHFDRLNRGLCDPRATVSYIEIIHNLERIADHCDNIAETVINDNQNTLDTKHKFEA